MKIGVVFPQIELSQDPSALGIFAREVEGMGFNHLLLYDHVVGASHEGRDPPLWGPYTDRDPFHEPMTAFAYLAGITSRIEFFTGILILPQRQTVLLAKQAAEVDRLSRGRLRLGVGTGWNYVEYDALDQDFPRRGARLSEQIPYLRRLWSEELLDFQGRFDRIDRGNIIPRPESQIPIYCGGFSEPAYRRAAKLADGFIFAGKTTETVLPAWNRLRELLLENGRANEPFAAHLIHTEWGKGRDVDALLPILDRWEEAGGTEASVLTMGLGFSGIDGHLQFLEDLARRRP